MRKNQKDQENLEKQNKALLFGFALSLALNIFTQSEKNKKINDIKKTKDRYLDINIELIEELNRCKTNLKELSEKHLLQD